MLAWWGCALECVPSCTQSHPRSPGTQTQEVSVCHSTYGRLPCQDVSLDT